MNPVVSVIMPVYNAEKYVGTAIESILKQSFDDFELLLIDDGSSDESGKICDMYALRDSRIRVFHQANAGRCRARNKGIELARGQYVAFSDDDDEYEPNLLEDNIKLATLNNADLVRFMRRKFYIGDDGSVKSVDEPKQSGQVYVFKGTAIYQNMSYFSRVAYTVWGCIFSRRFLIWHNITFDERYIHGFDDHKFILECYYFARIVVYNFQIYYNWYCRTGQSDSSNVSLNKLSMLDDVIATDYKLYRSKIAAYDFAYWANRSVAYISFVAIFLLYARKTLSLKEIKHRFCDIYKYLGGINNKKIFSCAIDCKKKIVLLLFYNKFYCILYFLYYICLINKIKNKTLSV